MIMSTIVENRHIISIEIIMIKVLFDDSTIFSILSNLSLEFLRGFGRGASRLFAIGVGGYFGWSIIDLARSDF
jgi:hypothetical protein